MACAEHEAQRAVGYRRNQAATNGAVASVVGPGEIERWDGHLMEAIPGRRLISRAHLSKAPGNACGCVRASCLNVGRGARQRGEERLCQPSRQELGKVTLFEGICQLLVGGAPSGSFEGAVETRSRANQDEVREVRRSRERCGQCNSSSHGVAENAEGFTVDQVEDAAGRVVERAAHIRRSAMSRQIDRKDGVMGTERCSELTPGRSVLGEAMTQDQQGTGAPRGRCKRGHQR